MAKTHDMVDLTGRQRLLQELRRNIMEGVLEPGQKLLSTRALAAKYRIALPTAHAALKQLGREGILARSTGRGTFVAAVKTVPATGFVTVLAPAQGHIWEQVTPKLLQGLQATGLNTRFSDFDPNALAKTPTPQLAEILLGTDRPLAVVVVYLQVARYISEKYPDLHVICLEDGHAASFLGDMIAPNRYRAAFLATRHLLRAGHKRIGCYAVSSAGTVLSPVRHRSDDLVDGHGDALVEAGIVPDWVFHFAPGADGADSIRAALARPDRPTAVYCCHDHRAVELVKVAAQLGLRIPEDLAVIGTGNTPWAEAYEFTTMDLRYDAVAAACVDRVRDLAAGKHQAGAWRDVRVEPRLVVRRSSGTTDRDDVPTGTTAEGESGWRSAIKGEAGTG